MQDWRHRSHGIGKRRPGEGSEWPDCNEVGYSRAKHVAAQGMEWRCGVGGWLADTLETNGLVVPEFSAELQAKIRAFLPSYGAAGNPIDITAQAIGTDFRVRALEALDASDEIDGIVVASATAFIRAAAPALFDQADQFLAFTPRQVYVDGVRQDEGLTLCGAQAPPCPG